MIPLSGVKNAVPDSQFFRKESEFHINQNSKFMKHNKFKLSGILRLFDKKKNPEPSGFDKKN